MAFRLYHGTMQPVLSLESSKSLDHQLIARFSLSESKLIDGAAEGIFRLTEPMIHGRILIAAGPGNNGSDGLALANILARHGYDVDVLLPYGNGNKENMRRRSELHASVGIARSAEGYDTIYDALFGFGYHGEADGNVRSIASSIPKESTVIAVDETQYSEENGVWKKLTDQETSAKQLKIQNAIRLKEIQDELDELDKKRIRALAEPSLKDEDTTWLEYYNSQISELRTEYNSISG